MKSGHIDNVLGGIQTNYGETLWNVHKSGCKTPQSRMQVIMKIRVGKLTLNKGEKMSRKIRVGIECPTLIHWPSKELSSNN